MCVIMSGSNYYLGRQKSSLPKVIKKNLLVYLILLAIGFRLTSFFPLVIDHDESTYLIIADQWLQGNIPYVDNIEVKPIGIFLLFTLVLKICSSVWMVRMVAAIALALTGFYLARGANLFFKNNRGIYVGILYVFTGSLHKWSWSANTELFFLLFSAIALYHFLRADKSYSIFWSGLAIGVGFLFKYHIVFDALAFGVFFIFLQKYPVGQILKRGWFLILGTTLPVFACLLWYFSMGYIDEFLFATWTIPSQYTSSPSLIPMLSFAGEFYLSFLPLSLVFLVGLVNTYQKRLYNIVLFCLIWLTCSWLGILVTGKNYFHYYFQALPCLCFFIPTFFESFNVRNKFQNSILESKLSRWIIILALMAITNLNQYQSWKKSPNYLGKAAEIIRSDLPPGGTIYTNHQNLIYYLTNAALPSKYVHTSLLYKMDLAKAFDVEPNQEFLNIIEKEPFYYLFRGDIPSIFHDEIKNNYHLATEFDEQTKLFRRTK